jgi:hypothetical protein
MGAMLAYLQSFLRVNSKQLATFALSIADGILMMKYPQLKPYEGIVATALLGFGIHLDRVVYTPAALAARLSTLKQPE